MARKLRVGIVFGGRSGEHEVSLRSAASVLAAIDKKKYEVVPIGVAKSGRWLVAEEAKQLLAGSAANKSQNSSQSALAVAKNAGTSLAKTSPASALARSDQQAEALGVDVLFPVLHGTFGEDGTMQGLFELADKAYVGSGVLGSAAGMDKDVMKRLFRDAGLPIVKHVTVLRADWQAE